MKKAFIALLALVTAAAAQTRNVSGTPSGSNLTITTPSGTLTIPNAAIAGSFAATSPAFTTSITTGSTTFAFLNTTATTINAFGAATTVNTGASATQIWNFGGSTTASELRFLEPSGSGTNYTSLKGQAQSANITYLWPATIGSTGQYLQCTVSGAVATLAWADASGVGSVATDAIFDAAGDLVLGTGANTAGRLAIGTARQLLQVNAGGTTAEWSSAISIDSADVTTVNAGALTFEGATADAFETSIAVVDPTADRTATLPNANTFIPVIPQILTITGPTAARTITIPDAAFTVARIDAANTFQGTQDFVDPPLFETGISIGPNGTGGVFLGYDGDGALQMLGAGTGADEGLTWNFDDVANTVGVSSGTGADIIAFASIDLRLDAPGTNSASVVTVGGSQTLTGKTATSLVLGTKVQLPTAAGSSTLSTAGDAAYNTANKLLGINTGSREDAVSTIYHREWSFDPKAVCDGAVDRLFLTSVDIDAPFGIHVIKWKVSFEADPTTEVDLDLKRADAFIGVANSAVMDVLDTTSGASTEATASNINSDAVVANGKVLYLEFGTAYTETTHQVIFEMWWTIEED